MDRVVTVGKTYRHFKGKDYKDLCIAKDSDSDPEDLKEVVVYEALYGRHIVWVRGYDEFLAPVDKEKYPDVTQEYRFEQID